MSNQATSTAQARRAENLPKRYNNSAIRQPYETDRLVDSYYDERVPSQQRRGAVRSEQARSAILAATAQLIARHGYDHVSIEGIAHEAGVGKQTIYRWWPSKSAVVAECLLEGLLIPDAFVPPDTESLE